MESDHYFAIDAGMPLVQESLQTGHCYMSLRHSSHSVAIFSGTFFSYKLDLQTSDFVTAISVP